MHNTDMTTQTTSDITFNGKILNFGNGPVAEFDHTFLMDDAVWRYDKPSIKEAIENAKKHCPSWVPELKKGLAAIINSENHNQQKPNE